MKKKLFIFSFIMTAFPLILAGTDTLDQGKAVFGTIYVLCGLAYASFALLAIRKDVNGNKWITLFGSLILLIVAFDYFLQAKKYLPYVYLAASLASLIPLLVKHLKKEREL
ncbi:hypothetical protein JNL27_03885 [bacterium]|nr:hypothetical protein [bacterium]